MEVDIAISLTIAALKKGDAGKYGYDLYPPELAGREVYQETGSWNGVDGIKYDRLFLDAAWELCRRGILRPGTRDRTAQAVDAGGYSLTTEGKKKLDSLLADDVIVMQPGSLAEALAGYAGLFGDAFLARSQEAIKCRNAEAWLGSCAMTGAAAESVLLSVAIAKSNDAAGIYAKYNGSGGRQKVINVVVGGLPDWMKSTFTTFTGIISVWRDEASHGSETTLGTANADESLRQLLHMCQWVKKNWAALTA